MTERTTRIDREDLRVPGRSGGRHYVWPPNEPEQDTYVSVTTALKALPQGEAIPRWAAKVTAEVAVEQHDLLGKLIENDPADAVDWLKKAPWNSRDRSANIGTMIHRIVELDTTGRRDEADEIMDSIADKLVHQKASHARHFFMAIQMSVDHVEFVTYHPGFGYAGTGDFIVTFHDPDVRLPGFIPPDDTYRPSVILDLKTGKGVYSEVALQLAAYRWASKMADLDVGELVDMPHTDGGMVLHVGYDGWRLLPVDTSEAVFRKFLDTLTMAKDTLPLSSSLVGTPIIKGKETL